MGDRTSAPRDLIPPPSLVLRTAHAYRARARFARKQGRRNEAARCYIIADRLVAMHDEDVLTGSSVAA